MKNMRVQNASIGALIGKVRARDQGFADNLQSLYDRLQKKDPTKAARLVSFGTRQAAAVENMPEEMQTEFFKQQKERFADPSKQSEIEEQLSQKKFTPIYQIVMPTKAKKKKKDIYERQNMKASVTNPYKKYTPMNEGGMAKGMGSAIKGNNFKGVF